jgi:glycosyltransferase involved in cell wall biosynthesis
MDGVTVEHRVIDRVRKVVDADLPDADVVIATWWETAEWVARLSAAKGVKAYFIQHDESTFASPADRIIATWKLPMHKITIAQWLVDLGGHRCPGDVIDLVPNSVDLEQFNAPARGKQKDRTVGLMYSEAEFKGTDIALEAIRLAMVRIPNLHVQAFGVRPVVGSLQLPRNSRYVRQPDQQTIVQVYSSCDAWLFASRTEGFGLPIVEAMACRTPVIGTPAGAAPELLSQGGGILVKPQDPHDMARAIERICDMKEPEWKKMSDAAYRTARRYTWDDATDRLEMVLKRIAKRSGAVHTSG